MKSSSPPLARFGLFLAMMAMLCLHPMHAAAGNTEEQARHHFDEGARYFYEGDFSRALVEFRRAYQLQPDPMILYNISLAHSRLGNIKDAFDAGIAASKMEGMPAPAQVRNDARVGALSIALSADSIARSIQNTGGQASSGEPDPDHIYIPPDHDTELSPMGWAGVAGTAAGAGLITWALVLNQKLGPEIEQYKSTESTEDYNERREDIDRRTTTGKIVLYSGAGLMTVGLGLWIYDVIAPSRASSYSFTVNLAPASGTGMLHVKKRF
ncbi:MAG: hypothetical protein ACNA8W_11150 [Bradymonadaceae bacterium]